MNREYYNAVRRMEEQGVDADYMAGWIGGYLQNPKREEQRVNDRYEAGYADGLEGRTDNIVASN
ncbi:MAG: hypothetical protein LLP51_01425 [Halorhodospira halophila]|uniref:Alvin_2107 family globule sulfur oxidation protein n=1 Tax=Halorhodospira TaxID=85108 RepID=UPI00191227CC|nr:MULTISPECIES: hypothetical protein [Halorhodospira]MBK5936533.1 hypothetical protein [Halorhodospira halophila]MBK5944250.1 hypothetical protein [Halorhodospira halophila]MCC3750041.1 hypothetical protein [Halorhodospira halophila]MCG5527629.1 hypothetical protein [Halorhodospira halophila]MCG5532648.1 hypothetical protein [Halorhodospira sp. 9621]